MGEDREQKKKASSLRGRVARSRQTYHRKSNPMPIIIGAVVLGVMGIAMYVFLGADEKRYTPPEADSTTESGASKKAASTQPGRAPSKTLFELLHWARIDRKKAPDKALADLVAKESEYGDIPDFQMAKAMTVDEKIGKAQGNAAKKILAEEKLRYLSKAQELLDDGKSWNKDPMGSKTGNLDTSLEQCRLLVKKYTQ